MAPGESGPEGLSAFQVYVGRPDTRDLESVLRRMSPDLRERARAVIAGQRGTGKSMDLTWMAAQLSRTHLVCWIDALGTDAEALRNPLNLFVAMALAVYRGAEACGGTPDRDLFRALVSTCLDTETRETLSEEGLNLRVDKMLAGMAEGVSRLLLPVTATASAATGNPLFIAAGALLEAVQSVLTGSESGISEKESARRVRVASPRVTKAAARLKLFVESVEKRLERPVVLIVDGLDRIPAGDVQALFERSKDLAQPNLRLIFTAPLTLYNSLEWADVQQFFPYLVCVPNVRCDPADDTGQQFLRQVVLRRLALYSYREEDIFDQGVLNTLVNASGGNIRQLIVLVDRAAQEAEREHLSRIDMATAAIAVNQKRTEIVNQTLARPQVLEAVLEFAHATHPLPPAGTIGDALLTANCILAYSAPGRPLQYALHPLILDELRERRLI